MTMIQVNHPGRAGRGVSYSLFSCIALTGIASFLASCAPPPDDIEPLAAITEAGDHQNWEVTRSIVQAHLLRHPDDILGHYYFGLSYLHTQSPQLTIAEGEFLTALRLLDQSEASSILFAGMDRDQLKGQIHRKAALVYMRGFREGTRLGLPESYTVDLLEKAYEQVENGLQANPESSHLKEYEEFLRETLGLDTLSAPKIITERRGGGISI